MLCLPRDLISGEQQLKQMFAEHQVYVSYESPEAVIKTLRQRQR